jgi:hypothetical protein
VALCLALHKGPRVFALRQYDFLVLCPITPLTLAWEREAFTPSRAKDDPSDAALQRAVRRTHREKLPPLQPPRPTMRALAQRVAHRRRVVGAKVRMTHRLTSTRKHYVPQVLQGCEEKATPLFCDFLSRWPPRNAAQLARRTTREPFLRDHHVRADNVIAQRRHAIQAATPLTPAEGVLAPHALWVQALVAPRRVTVQAIADCDTAITPRAQRPPDFPLCQALPGAGPVFAPHLLGAVGEQRARSASAAALQK